MMTIHFDCESDKWYHQDPHHSWSWGHNRMEMPFQLIDTDSILFSMRTYNGKTGPLIGLLTSTMMKAQLNEQPSSHIIDLHYIIQKQGGLLLIFSPEDMYTTYMSGKVYHQSEKKWIDVVTPLPDVVYNRFPGRKREKEGICQQVVRRCQKEKIPFFNPHFFSKWDLHQLFSEQPFLKEHLPETLQYKSSLTISEMLDRHPAIYIKPAEGSKGKGIYRAAKTPEGKLLVETIKKSMVYIHLNDFIRISSFNENWLVQQAIQPDHISGKRYDLRIIATRSKKKHQVSGIGIRQSLTQDVTTHVPNGGQIIPLSQVSERLDFPLIENITAACGDALEKQYGLIGEFSIDMTKSIEGRYYLLEVNAKPMIFDEPDIQQERLRNLASLFYHISHFSHSSITTEQPMIN
ncbi:YheC/YheD family endospore coat-associated protein [Priestia abyssalis]|uniref:YheC/YheD family endospore coat-associated protein n=1 Tax=Priestia abyssalis TaxID=1221450 RepID=UPI000994978E|nr:YheC/YheD family protein [Priestia abyssalis]